MNKNTETFFRATLLEWYSQSYRPMPWKGQKDPYRIWLSEIILQQTRVEQGLPYYERFLEKYPSLKELAQAPEDEVMKLWEGLGYYSRAKNMLATARYLLEHQNGRFPETYEELLSLKGVGTYTAAAIASFAYDLPCAVLDGNVFRVLARFFGIELPIDSSAGKKVFSNLARQLLDTSQPGRYNQALMDFGATLCTPKTPDCSGCPFQNRCSAFARQRVGHLPVKNKKAPHKERFFHYLLLQHEDRLLLRKRLEKDIWQNLYDFPLLEWPTPALTETELITSSVWNQLVGNQPHLIRRISHPFRQTLSHQKITAFFWEIELPSGLPKPNGTLLVAERKNLTKFAFPKIIDWYLRDKSLSLKPF